MTRPRVGVSRCLLGDAVRYDGGHKLDPFLVDTFGRYVEWMPVCPEMEMGMGTPREPIQLVASGDGLRSGIHRVRLVGVHSHRDWTAGMERWRRARIEELTHANLSGYVLKKDSPSCGLAGVRVRDAEGETRDGVGLFAAALVEAMPELPAEDESRLRDRALRENFIERVFAYDRLTRLFGSPWTLGGLVAFHTAHKLQLLSHSREAYDRLGQLVAGGKELSRDDVRALYTREFMSALRAPATRGTHADAMQHVLGHFRRRREDDSRRSLAAAIEDYRQGLVAFETPMALIRRYVRDNDVEYLAEQVYLDPYPSELCQPTHA